MKVFIWDGDRVEMCFPIPWIWAGGVRILVLKVGYGQGCGCR